jgi:hypothetical protein
MPQGIAILDTNKLREILIGEIYAINGYAEHIANSNMEDINAAWKSIMGDEKKHYGMILTVLRKYDSAQYQVYKEHIGDKLGPKSPMQTYTPNYDKQIIDEAKTIILSKRFKNFSDSAGNQLNLSKLIDKNRNVLIIKSE